jgi:hypothetical protein
MPRKQQVNVELRKQEKNGHDKWSSRFETERRGQVTWSDAGAEDLLDAVSAATGDGAALLLGTTTDGGALTIHVLTTGGTHKLYPATVAELHQALAMIAEIARSF